MPPPNDRVRPYKAETAATGGTASDDRPYPRVLDPQRDALDAAGLFMQQVGSADRNVAVWREGNLMHFRDGSMAANTSVTLSQLASGGGGDPTSPWTSLMDIQPRQSSDLNGLLREFTVLELQDEDYPHEYPFRVLSSVKDLVWVRFSAVVFGPIEGEVRLWIEGSEDGGWTWRPLAPSMGNEPVVIATNGGGGGPDGNLYKSDVVPLELSDPDFGGTAEALWLRVMLEQYKAEGSVRLGAIRVEGMALEGLE